MKQPESIKKPGQVTDMTNDIQQKDDRTSMPLYFNRHCKHSIENVLPIMRRLGYTNSKGLKLKQNDLILWIMTKGIEAYNNEFGQVDEQLHIEDPNY